MANLIDGRKIVNYIEKSVLQEVKKLNAMNLYPCIAVCLVGSDPASVIYVRNKQKACERVGMNNFRLFGMNAIKSLIFTKLLFFIGFLKNTFLAAKMSCGIL